MELLSRDDAALRLGVTLDDVEQMICDGLLFAVRFATGVKIIVDDDDSADATPSLSQP